MVDLLRSLIERLCTEEGFSSSEISGLTLFRTSVAGDPGARIEEPPYHQPGVCVVLTGRKHATVGTRRITYEPRTYSIVSVDLPVTDMLVEATDADPFLGLRLALDPAVLSELLIDLAAADTDTLPGWGIAASPLSAELISPLQRLVGALDDPYDIAVLAPAIKREISYRLLRGPHRALLRQIANPDSRLSQIRRAIDDIRERYSEPLRIDALAKATGMSPSSFHQHFKAVTAMSPLQYQKQLRLQAARRLILDGHADATTASYEVGYESPSQFSREYKRLFGAPPMRDRARVRSVS